MKITNEMVLAAARAWEQDFDLYDDGFRADALEDARRALEAVADVRRARAARAVPYDIEDCGYRTPCWVWKKSTCKDGYADMRVDGKQKRAHRHFYEMHVGAIPEGLVLDHLCRNKSCVNPEHLEPVTRAENRRRGDGMKLTAVLAEQIRRAEGTQRDIAAKFGVCQTTVSHIKRGLTWKEGA